MESAGNARVDVSGLHNILKTGNLEEVIKAAKVFCVRQANKCAKLEVGITKNSAIRDWYNGFINAFHETWEEDIKDNPNFSLEDKARLSYEIRYLARFKVREYMHKQDVEALEKRDLKKYLHKDGPTFEYLVDKQLHAQHQVGSNIDMDTVYKFIIASSTRINIYYNILNKLGLIALYDNVKENVFTLASATFMGGVSGYKNGGLLGSVVGGISNGAKSMVNKIMSERIADYVASYYGEASPRLRENLAAVASGAINGGLKGCQYGGLLGLAVGAIGGGITSLIFKNVVTEITDFAISCCSTNRPILVSQ